ncbi:unnamed protein product [Phytomonas sp. EM1]|nr:unnamed protein product [Phytomonas sp. EM1]|eukprot:CCW64594.1 unnamed protein product [Phytomonas sp. isolate EM1]
MPNITLSNVEGDSVVIPEEVARRLFNKFSVVDTFLLAVRPPSRDSNSSGGDGEGEETEETLSSGAGRLQEEEPLRITQLHASREVLQVVAHYAMLPSDQRTENIPRPLKRCYAESVMPHELELVKQAEEMNYLRNLFEVAFDLRFEQLLALCGAYTNERIWEISRESPDIMTAAQRIREFLKIENTWSAEEMENLSKEMALAKKLDPHAY